MKNMKNMCAFCGLAILIAGCAPFPVEGWKKSSNAFTDEQMQKDIIECQTVATQAVGPPPNFGTVVWFSDRNSAFELCMKSRGYSR